MTPARKKPLPLYIQPRDHELLRMLLDDFGLLTRGQICELFPERGIRRTNRRLRQLVHAGYLSIRYPTGYLMQRIPFYHLGPYAFEPLHLDPHDPTFLARRKQAANLTDRA